MESKLLTKTFCQIEGIRKPTVFRNSGIFRDFQMLKEFIKEVKQYFERVREDGNREAELMMAASKKAQGKENQNVKRI